MSDMARSGLQSAWHTKQPFIAVTLVNEWIPMVW
jgi:hypothetical protein